MHGEIENVQLVRVQLINHEADDFLAVLGHHTVALSLAQATAKIFFGPGEFKALLFGLKVFGHVAANHPANMDACLFLLGFAQAHDDLPSPRRRSLPPWGATAPRLPCSDPLSSDGL